MNVRRAVYFPLLFFLLFALGLAAVTYQFGIVVYFQELDQRTQKVDQQKRNSSYLLESRRAACDFAVQQAREFRTGRVQRFNDIKRALDNCGISLKDVR